MAQNALNNAKEWGIAKTNRWIGYAQCLMVATGTKTLEEIMEDTGHIVNSFEKK